jgi:long-chain fatty acid transport protein
MKLSTRSTDKSGPKPLQKMSVDTGVARWTRGFCLLALTLCLPAFAEGLRTIPPGAFDLGRSGGRFAHVNDASAAWNNPANLVEATNVQAEIVAAPIYMSIDHTSSTGGEVQTENPWKFLADAFLAVPLGEGKYAAGLGVTMPYGLGVQWDHASPASPFYFYAPYESGMTAVNINPNFAVRLLDNLSVGAGLDALWSEIQIRQFYLWNQWPAVAPTSLTGDSHLKGDGWGWGGNVAVTWEFLKHHRLAATYRSQQTVQYEGSFEIDGIASSTAALLGATESSSFETEIGFPNIVGVGYGVELSDRVRVEINGEWLQWSRFQSLQVDIANNNLLLTGPGGGPSTIPQNWKDTFTAGIAGDYRISDHWMIRCGYQFYESPVPDSTFSPTIPDSNQHVITLGVGFRSQRHAVEAAYGLDLYEKREIQTGKPIASNFDGTYEWNVHLFSLSYRYSF